MNREEAIEYFEKSAEENEEFGQLWNSLTDEQKDVYIGGLMEEVNRVFDDFVDEWNKAIRDANRKLKGK